MLLKKLSIVTIIIIYYKIETFCKLIKCLLIAKFVNFL